jgi:hypothetical protein
MAVAGVAELRLVTKVEVTTRGNAGVFAALDNGLATTLAA